MAKNVILTEIGFKNIYRGYLKYIALQSGGVDNWEWYGDSLNAFCETGILKIILIIP